MGREAFSFFHDTCLGSYHDKKYRGRPLVLDQGHSKLNQMNVGHLHDDSGITSLSLSVICSLCSLETMSRRSKGDTPLILGIPLPFPVSLNLPPHTSSSSPTHVLIALGFSFVFSFYGLIYLLNGDQDF